MNKKLAGFLIITAALVSLAVWELWGRESLTYKEVLVLVRDLPAGSVISAEDLDLIRLEKPPEGALTGEDSQELIGLETAQFVPAGAPLDSAYFRQSRFAVGIDTGRGIMAVPQEWLLSLPQTLRRGDTVDFYSGETRVLTAVVAYARDSANQEVVSYDRERLDASASIHLLEIVGDTEELTALAALAAGGERFALLYS